MATGDPLHQHETKPNPDPTVATNDAVERAMKSERDYVDGQVNVLIARLDASDQATTIRLALVDDIPSKIEAAIVHLDTLTDAKFAKVDARFDMTEKQRIEQKTDTKVGVDAALSAAKEAVKEQTLASATAIAKSEAATFEQLKQLGVNFTTTIAGVTTTLNDLKDRVVKIESVRLGGQEERTEHRQSNAAVYAAVGFGVTLLLTLLTVVGILIAKGPPP